MVSVTRAFYNPAWLVAGVLLATGCGKPAPPPQGASDNATAPTVDLGSESSAPNPSDASPAGAQGEQK